MLRVIIYVWCCFMQGATPDGRNPMFVAPPGLDDASEQLRAKIKTGLAAEGQVKVFYFPKGKEHYSATYDISSRDLVVTFLLEKKNGQAIIPIQYNFHQEMLKGYILKSGHSAPNITDIDFSVKDVDSKHYSWKNFYSRGLDYFLIAGFPKLAEEGKETCDIDSEPLTADTLQTLLKKEKNKRFSWKVMCEDQAMDVFQKQKKTPEVLLIIGGVGILCGTLIRCFFKQDLDADVRSLFFYKIENTLGDICIKYPISEGKRLACLNCNWDKEQ